MLSKVQLFETAFLVILARGLVLGLSLSDAAILLGLIGVIGYQSHLASKKVESTESLDKTIADLNNKVNTLMVAQGMRRMSPSTGADFGQLKR